VDEIARAIDPPILVAVGGDVALIEDGRHRTTAAREAGSPVILAEARLAGDACWCGTVHDDGRCEFWPLGHRVHPRPRLRICPGCGTNRRITALVRL
jgi:hypothetical protein